PRWYKNTSRLGKWHDEARCGGVPRRHGSGRWFKFCLAGAWRQSNVSTAYNPAGCPASRTKGRDADNLFKPQARPEARAPPRARTARRIPRRLQRGDHARARVHGRFPGGSHPHRDGDYTDRARGRRRTCDGSRPREDHGGWAAGTRGASMALILGRASAAIEIVILEIGDRTQVK